MPANTNAPTRLGGNKNSPAQLQSNPNRQDLLMARTCEVLFIDPAVSDRGTILGNLRPEVEAILLDRTRPAARQIAASLEGRRGLDSVHVIAHGAPGRVSFAAGDWSAASLEEEAEDLAAIGRARCRTADLSADSCQTWASPAGAAL